MRGCLLQGVGSPQPPTDKVHPPGGDGVLPPWRAGCPLPAGMVAMPCAAVRGGCPSWSLLCWGTPGQGKGGHAATGAASPTTGAGGQGLGGTVQAGGGTGQAEVARCRQEGAWDRQEWPRTGRR